MNCKKLINDFLFDYHAGKLSLVRKVEFELHLAMCRDCRRYVNSYKKTVYLAKSAGVVEESVPAELVEAILKAARAGD